MSQDTFERGLPQPPGEALPPQATQPHAGSPVPPAPAGTSLRPQPPQDGSTLGVAASNAASHRVERTNPLVAAAAVALALLWVVVTAPGGTSDVLIFTGGIGLTMGIIAFFGALLVLRGKGKPPAPAAWVSLALTTLLACVPAVTSSSATRALNAVLLAFSCMTTLRLLAGATPADALSAGGLLRSVGFFLRSQFAHFGAPFRVGEDATTKTPTPSQAGPILTGLLISAALLMVLVPLLASVEPLIGEVAGRLLRDLRWLDLPSLVLRGARVVIFSCMACSLLLSALRREAREDTAAARNAPALRGATVATVLAVLDALYLLFVAIQMGRALMGPEAFAEHHAAAARESFFQLVAVAAINLLVLSVCFWGRTGARPHAAITALELVMLALTCAMLALSALSMLGYVQAYGLTYLRALTSLAMVGIALLVVLFCVRALRPTFPLFATSAAGLCALWLAFALSCPDARIAWHNVSGYLSGSIETIDVDYLASLSEEADGALEHLAATIERDDPHRKDVEETSELLRRRAWEDDVWGNWPLRTVGTLLRLS